MLLTIFTPTYNRISTLDRTYESLKKQTVKNFEWLIIDDGSTDNTKEVVNNWIKKNNLFKIRYIYKENGGLHTGYNKAIELSTSELMMCIDSDDYVPENAVELIENIWKNSDQKEYAGIIGLDYNLNGKCIGNKLPNQESINLIDICLGKVKIFGDKKHVVRTDLYKKVYPMPTFKKEKNFNPYYLLLKISKDYDFIILNENLCYVDYQLDGMTANQWKQYLNSPNSFFETRRLYLSFKGGTFFYYIKQSLHYCSSSQIAKRKDWFIKSPKKILTILLWIPALFLTKYIMIKNNIK